MQPQIIILVFPVNIPKGQSLGCDGEAGSHFGCPQTWVGSVFPSPFLGHEYKIAFIYFLLERPLSPYPVLWGISLDGDYGVHLAS